MATESTTLTQPHDCGRSIASIVQEIDRLKAESERLQATVDRLRAAIETGENSCPDDWGLTYVYTFQLRKALEGGA